MPKRPAGARSAVRAAATLLGAAASLTATLPAPAQEPRPGFERVWSSATVYKGDEDSFFDTVKLGGRFHADYVNIDAREGEHSDTALRRLRFGVKAQFLDRFTVHTEADYLWDDGQPVYERLTDAYIAWSRSPAAVVTVGKHTAGFTLDGMTSSNQLITIDRSNLANNLWFTDEYIPGVSVEGESGKLVYQTGIYSSGPKDRGFGDSSGGEFLLATVGYDFGARWGSDSALLRFNVVDQGADPENTFTRPFERIYSTSLVFQRGRLGLRGDLSAGSGYLGQSDVKGALFLPSFDIHERLQVVARYTYVASKDPNGVRFARYENEIVSGRGDHYREIYLGANYFFNGHKLKVQTGAHHVRMDDRAADGGAYRGWAWATSLRFSW